MLFDLLVNSSVCTALFLSAPICLLHHAHRLASPERCALLLILRRSKRGASKFVCVNLHAVGLEGVHTPENRMMRCKSVQ